MEDKSAPADTQVARLAESRCLLFACRERRARSVLILDEYSKNTEVMIRRIARFLLTEENARGVKTQRKALAMYFSSIVPIVRVERTGLKRSLEDHEQKCSWSWIVVTGRVDHQHYHHRRPFVAARTVHLVLVGGTAVARSSRDWDGTERFWISVESGPTCERRTPWFHSPTQDRDKCGETLRMQNANYRHTTGTCSV